MLTRARSRLPSSLLAVLLPPLLLALAACQPPAPASASSPAAAADEAATAGPHSRTVMIDAPPLPRSAPEAPLASVPAQPAPAARPMPDLPSLPGGGGPGMSQGQVMVAIDAASAKVTRDCDVLTSRAQRERRLSALRACKVAWATSFEARMKSVDCATVQRITQCLGDAHVHGYTVADYEADKKAALAAPRTP